MAQRRRAALALAVSLAAAANPSSQLGPSLDFSGTVPQPSAIPSMPPSVAPDGTALSLDSLGFALNGTRLFNVAGEMHFSRVPASQWASDLRLMRAAGLTTVSTYVLWIHHEEVRGAYDWSGQRNLTAFVEAAQAAGLMVALRCGPYSHAEVRGGALPDWLQAVAGIQLRSTQPLFMGYATEWYTALRGQLPDALWWQHGGPIISMQLDNESNNGAYLVALRAVAVAVGLAPPFYAVTGLNKGIPFGAAQPLSGRYAVQFWAKPGAAFSPSGAWGRGGVGGHVVGLCCSVVVDFVLLITAAVVVSVGGGWNATSRRAPSAPPTPPRLARAGALPPSLPHPTTSGEACCAAGLEASRHQ